MKYYFASMENTVLIQFNKMQVGDDTMLLRSSGATNLSQRKMC